MHLLIQDNGVGFNVPEKWVELLRESHYGLAGMAERVQLFGGTFNVVSNLGQGTLVQTTIPIV